MLEPLRGSLSFLDFTTTFILFRKLSLLGLIKYKGLYMMSNVKLLSLGTFLYPLLGSRVWRVVGFEDPKIFKQFKLVMDTELMSIERILGIGISYLCMEKFVPWELLFFLFIFSSLLFVFTIANPVTYV